MAIALGIVMGLLLGLTGAGGSILAVPLLMLGLGWSLTQAVPVALLAVAAASAFGTWVAWDKTYVRYRAAMLMGLAGALVSPLGLLAAARVPSLTLLLIFCGVMLVVAVRLYRQAVSKPVEAAVVRATVAGEGAHAGGAICRLNANGRIVWTRRCSALIGGIGSATGFLSGLLGVGGGFVIVPSLRATTELSMHSAVATSLMTIALIASGTVAASVALGHDLPWLQAVPFAGGALIGMIASRRLAPKLAGPRLQEGFALFMGLSAVGLAAHAAAFF